MERISILSMQRVHSVSTEMPRIVVRIRPPMQAAGDDIVAAERIRVVVAAALHDVNFAAGGPRAVGVGDGEHPDGGPEPVALGDAGGDFDAAVFDGGAGFGVEAPGFDGLDDGAVGGVGAGYAVAPERGGAGAVGGEVDDCVGVDQGLVLESGLDVERAVLDED